jgi:hypothetical protein
MPKMRDNLDMEDDETKDQEEPLPALEPNNLADKLRLIEQLRGCTTGGPSMCDMLLEERHREHDLELAKDGW